MTNKYVTVEEFEQAIREDERTKQRAIKQAIRNYELQRNKLYIQKILGGVLSLFNILAIKYGWLNENGNNGSALWILFLTVPFGVWLLVSNKLLVDNYIKEVV